MIETALALTSTQKGKVTEQLVASALLIASNGRLAPFVPLADDHRTFSAILRLPLAPFGRPLGLPDLPFLN